MKYSTQTFAKQQMSLVYCFIIAGYSVLKSNFKCT